jgi:hypothetical protein
MKRMTAGFPFQVSHRRVKPAPASALAKAAPHPGPPAQPHRRVSIERPILLADGDRAIVVLEILGVAAAYE